MGVVVVQDTATRFKRILLSWVGIGLGVMIASGTHGGIAYENYMQVVFVIVLLTMLNNLLKPVLILLTLPFIVLTLGLGLWLLNALLFYFVGNLINGFYVADFWAALWGALWISLANWFLGSFSKDRTERRGVRVHVRGREPQQPASEPSENPQTPKNKRIDDDVIDI